MPPEPIRIPTRHGEALVVDSYRHIDPALWQRSLTEECMDWRYYEIVEETIPQDFTYRYLILTNPQTGAQIVQPFFLVAQDITAGLPAPLRTPVLWVRKKFPRFLSMKILMVGCAAGEGSLACAEPWAVEMLEEAIGRYAKIARASVILFKDFPAKYREPLAALTRKGYTRAPSMPGAERALDFATFDEFLEKNCSRIYRKSLRRKFRDASHLGELTMEVTADITPYVDAVHPLYLQTHDRSELKFECLTKEYLCELSRRMPDRVRYFLWRLNGKIVAFALCLIHGHTLHDLNVGMDYAVALDLHSYFITWRDIVLWGVGEKLEHYYTGPLNYDPKLHLRLRLAPLDLYARHTAAWINPIFGRAMAFLQPARHDATLKKFPNAHEI